MAILLEGCDGAPVIWGRLGEYVIQRTKTGRMSIRRYIKGSNPRTVKQQKNREAFKLGLSRWTQFERERNGVYWTKIAGEKGFRDGYRAFLSSFMATYHRKVRELGSDGLALAWVTLVDNLIEWEDSLSRKEKRAKSDHLNAMIIRFRSSREFQSSHDASLIYLINKGWQGKIRYDLMPKLNLSTEWNILSLGLVVTT